MATNSKIGPALMLPHTFIKVWQIPISMPVLAKAATYKLRHTSRPVKQVLQGTDLSPLPVPNCYLLDDQGMLVALYTTPPAATRSTSLPPDVLLVGLALQASTTGC
jgi:hypothetical protein